MGWHIVKGASFLVQRIGLARSVHAPSQAVFRRYAGCMDTPLKGRNAILARRIRELREHITVCESLAPGSSETELQNDRRLLSLMQSEMQNGQVRKTIVLFGTEHGCQRNGDQLNAQLSERILCLVDQLAATVLMEEWSESGAASFASTLGMPYFNVGTGPDTQFKTYPTDVRYPGYVNGTLDSSDEFPSMAEYGPLENQENRENRMIENSCEAMKEHDVGLLLIGLAHLHSMSRKCLKEGFNVFAFSWLGNR